MVRRPVRDSAITVALLVAIAVVALALLAPLAPLGPEPSSDADHSPTGQSDGSDGGEVFASGGPTLGQTNVENFSRTVFRIEVFENGDARWTTEYSRPLDGDEEAQFEEFIDTFETEETQAFDNFQIRAAALTDSASSATGRDMQATDFDREAEIDRLGQTRGVARMSFVWTNFTSQSGDRLVVADVFGGGWAIDTDQRLQISTGPSGNLSMDLVEPAPDSGSLEENSVTWFGERQFADRRPRVEFVPDGTSEPPNGTDDEDTGTGDGDTADQTDDSDDTTDPDGSDDSTAGITIAIVLLVVILALGIGLAWYTGALRRSGESSAEGETTTVTEPADPEPAADAGATLPVEEPISDEDQVLNLLDDNGGRMKQVSIVEETNWSKSKVSMLLSDMEDDGLITKLRVGRENIISLVGQEPEAAGSPFEDE